MEQISKYTRNYRVLEVWSYRKTIITIPAINKTWLDVLILYFQVVVRAMKVEVDCFGFNEQKVQIFCR